MVEIKAKGVLFDMDGTLVDTTACVERAWLAMGSKYGLDCDHLLKHVHGRPCLDTLRAFFPIACHTPEFAKSFEKSFVNVTEGVNAVPGAHAAIAAIGADKWAVVTAASRMWAETRLTQVGIPLPQYMVSSDDILNGKPHPEGYLCGAAALGQLPADVVVFEDAVNGVKAGVAAGATVVALVTSTERAALEKAGAHYVVDDFTHINFTDCGDHILLTI
ncbi:hypothetical protein IWW54_005692 [Coemansia sp. RSA 2705]|nr:hypothetical protein IWW54_005692 [Coemansia sp. RSA 2705]